MVEGKSEKILIKKYGNRRLYDTRQKRYITLDELTELIESGYEIEVVDSKSGENLTQQVLIQVILESQKSNPHGLFTSEFLHQLIQYQDQSIAEFFHEYLPGIFRSYMQWQKEAHKQFMNWATLGWSANPYMRNYKFPGFPSWFMPEDEPVPANGSTSSSEDEVERLKQKIEELEQRLQSRPKRKSS